MNLSLSLLKFLINSYGFCSKSSILSTHPEASLKTLLYMCAHDHKCLSVVKGPENSINGVGWLCSENFLVSSKPLRGWIVALKKSNFAKADGIEVNRRVHTCDPVLLPLRGPYTPESAYKLCETYAECSTYSLYYGHSIQIEHTNETINLPILFLCKGKSEIIEDVGWGNKNASISINYSIY